MGISLGVSISKLSGRGEICREEVGWRINDCMRFKFIKGLNMFIRACTTGVKIQQAC